MSSAGGRPSWQKMASVGTSIVPPGRRPPPADTPVPSTAAIAPQVKASFHDFAGSLPEPPGDLPGAVGVDGVAVSVVRGDALDQEVPTVCPL
jgi:hypothetical protein